MGKLYRWLGLNVGLIVQGIDGDARRRAYNADITYGTNNEYGFDYLRDNMVTYKDNMVQRGHAFAIVDEVDSILIDEARTPLIISGKGEDSSSCTLRWTALSALCTKAWWSSWKIRWRPMSRPTAIMSWTKSTRPVP